MIKVGRSLTLLLASCLLASGQTIRGGYNISTVAGSNFAGDGGPAIQGLLSQPEGIAVDSKGVVYVADADDHRVRKISTDGNIYTIAGNGFAGFSGDGGPAAAAQLNSPYGLCLDRWAISISLIWGTPVCAEYLLMAPSQQSRVAER